MTGKSSCGCDILVILLFFFVWPGVRSETEAWSSAVELRNGDKYFISNKTVRMVMNNNHYLFQDLNLFYYRQRDESTSFLRNVPTHRPLKIALIPATHSEDGVDEGAELLVATEHCLCTVNIRDDPWGERMSTEAGNCFESGIRDGPRHFARFTSLGAISPSGKQIWAVTDNLILAEQTQTSRLCLIDNHRVITVGGNPFFFPAIHTLSVSVLARGHMTEIFIAISWESKKGLDVLRIPHYAAGLHELSQDSFEILQPPLIMNKTVRFSQIIANSFRFWHHGERQLYIFTVDADGIVARSTVSWSAWEAMAYSVLQRVEDSAQIISFSVDFPWGIFVGRSVQKGFAKINSLGCICPPGYAILPSSNAQPHCQIAPAGGYVDILGNFIQCLPGTYKAHPLATSNAACLACPAFKVAPRAQSMGCSPCISVRNETGEIILLPHNPDKTQCLAEGDLCPLGTFLDAGGCQKCAAGFSASTPSAGCQRCPSNTYSDPANGTFACTACPRGKISTENSASAACSSLCPEHTCASSGQGACIPARPTGGHVVLTVGILGIQAVAAEAASNGTVYIAGFQMLIVVDRSGSAIHIPISEFTMIRDIKLSNDEKILYAAVTAQEVLRLTFVGTHRITRARMTWIPGATIVGIVPSPDGQWLVHDSRSNCIFSGTPSAPVWGTLYAGNSSLIMTMLLAREEVYVLVQNHRGGIQQQLLVFHLADTRRRASFDLTATLNPHLAFWRDRLIVSVGNAVGWLEGRQVRSMVGLENISGRVDHMDLAARFTRPGPMISHRLHPQVLLVVDQHGLRAVYDRGSECLCDKDLYLLEEEGSMRACIPCPQGTTALAGTVGKCTSCSRGEYFDAAGQCVPCPRFMWWKDAAVDIPCPLMLDTMVGRDTTGLSALDIFFEMSEDNPQHASAFNIMMKDSDYLSTQTLQLPLQDDPVPFHGRFWVRTRRITPSLHGQLGVSLPGFWVVCSTSVLQTETCVCDLAAEGLTMIHFWNRERDRAASIDYASLLAPVDDGSVDAVSPTALFVARTDAGGGRANLIFIKAISSAMRVPVPPPAITAPDASSFAACIAGWPATYSCPPGFLWVAPRHTCVPCRPGFYFAAALGRCLPCPIGSFSSLEGSTVCTVCPSVRVPASASCHASWPPNGTQCPAGFERGMRDGAHCLPCAAGFFKARASDTVCSPCAAGTFSPSHGQSECTQCSFPHVSTQWGSTACVACAPGAVPSLALDGCAPCRINQQYFTVDPETEKPVCKNKTTLRCGRGEYLDDGGPMAENRCARCRPCENGQVMLPYNAHPCNHASTTRLGAPYRCVAVESFPGLFARLSLLSSDIHNISLQYTPCAGLPAYASWSHGPDPSLCFFKCNYGISGAGARQYNYYYANERGVWLEWSATLAAVLGLPAEENLFILDYPGLSKHLMLLAAEICLPCPQTQCGWGKYRPITDSIHGCGPPTCAMDQTPPCQVFAGGVATYYANDGCTMDCTAPSNAYVSGLAPPGTGDNCEWSCKLGFYKDRAPNETAWGCIPCEVHVCEQGQEFIPSRCLPSQPKSHFCIACRATRTDLGVLSPNTPRGVCTYDCPPGTYSERGSCILCNNASFCPAGFRRVCAPEPCIPCPPLAQSLWSSAVIMPSNRGSCQIACKKGYHTLDLASGMVIAANALANSYDAETVSCALCSLRPSLPCWTSRQCPAGYFMPVAGSGICRSCPTALDCAAGFFPSGCICALCNPSGKTILQSVFVHRLAAEALFRMLGAELARREIIMDWDTCPTACPHNSVLTMGQCTPCSALVDSAGRGFQAYYAVWNASHGIRWWDPAQDPPHLPPRPSSRTEERRAGLCWPCPDDTLTGGTDWDLCMSRSSQETFASIQHRVMLPRLMMSQNSSDSQLILTSADMIQSALPTISSILFKGLSLLRSSVTTLSMDEATGWAQASSSRSRRRLLSIFPAAKEKGGILVHPLVHWKPFGSQHAIRTCPAFAEWYNRTTGECICRDGFQRHSTRNICIPWQERKRIVERDQTSSEEKQPPIRVVKLTKKKKEATSQVEEEGVCPEGKFKDRTGNCRLCPLMHAYDRSTDSCICAWACTQLCHANTTSRPMYHDAHAGCSHCPGNMVPLHALVLRSWHACGCPKGHQLLPHKHGCELCPIGTFSGSIGLSPCMACPEGTQTLWQGAERLTQCLPIGLAEDNVFIHPGDEQFYLNKK